MYGLNVESTTKASVPHAKVHAAVEAEAELEACIVHTRQWRQVYGLNVESTTKASVPHAKVHAAVEAEAEVEACGRAPPANHPGRVCLCASFTAFREEHCVRGVTSGSSSPK